MSGHDHQWREVPVLAAGRSMRYRCVAPGCSAWGYVGQNTGRRVRPHQERVRVELQRRYDELLDTGETTEAML